MYKGREKTQPTHQIQNINHQHNNQPRFAHSRPSSNAALENDNITGWDHQAILVQQNLNVFCNRLNNSKPKCKPTQGRKNVMRQTVRLGSAVEKERLSVASRAKGRRASDNLSKNTNSDIVGSQNMDPLRHREVTNLANEKCMVFTDNDQPKNQFQGQFSHIEVLKFEARHLERQEFTKGKFPTFSSLHQEGALAYSVSENSTRLENKSKSRQQQRQTRRDGPTSQASHCHSSSHHGKPSCKFYKTLTSQWINTKNPSLIIQPAFCSFNSSCPNNNGTSSSNGAHNWGTKQKQKEAQLLDFSCVLGMNLISGIANGPVAREQFKTIHWKKSRPFTKFFQSKKKKVGESVVNGAVSESGTPCKKGQGKGMKQIEGRKLYQLLTLNRQVIELEDF